MNETLYLKCKRKNYTPAHVCEVGVYYPETSNILGFIKEGIKTTLVEPLPECIELINLYFAEYHNVTLHPYAIADISGEIEMFMHESSSFAANLLSSPALKNDSYDKEKGKRLIVQAKTFNEIDDGSISLISIDAEGSEWYVLKHMVSRPDVISLELKSKHYINPFLKEINSWLDENGYIKWYDERSDSIFIKKGVFDLTNFEKLKNKI
jgi:FkbM family methyltransferase